MNAPVSAVERRRAVFSGKWYIRVGLGKNVSDRARGAL